ncbi:MAG: DUF4870 domain-containing protein [Vicinamibacteria bacterium]|nr:DUF4870 domain-containing protein [Vicinamibacteria bacterium]
MTDENDVQLPDDTVSMPTKDERNLGMLAHLLGIFSGFIGPLIIWLIKKDESAFVDDQGKESLNFQLTLLIAYFVSFVLMFLCVGYFTFLAAWVVGIIFSVIGTTTANRGERYRYPICIRMIS